MSVDFSLSEKLTNLTNCNRKRNIDLDTNRHNLKNTFLGKCTSPNNEIKENENPNTPSKKAKCLENYENSLARFIPDCTDFSDSFLDRKINNYHWSPIHSSKYHKNTLNTLTRNMTISKPMPHLLSLFQLHTLHLHLFLSLTLILVTKCPQYVIVLCNSI